jgi:hypothetical protein
MSTVVLGCTLMLGACALPDTHDLADDSSNASSSASSSGSLTVESGHGGASIRPPKGVALWWGTFHVATLCATSPVTIVSARPLWKTRPRSWQVLIRRVDHFDTHRPSTSQLGTAWGLPPEFAQPYAYLHLSGTFASPAGQEIGGISCDSHSGRYVELLLAVRTGARGAEAVGISLRYKNGAGQTKTVVARHWQMITCGPLAPRPQC